MKENKKTFLFWGGVIVSFIWMCILCFYHLGESGVANWDEARHIINAYEMYQTKEWWITTYRYGVDYFNYKPPFSTWMIILNAQLFGWSYFSVRLYSAGCMAVIFLIAVMWVNKISGHKAALITAALLTTGVDVIFFHMSRSADADALYILMMVAAFLCLYYTEKKPWLLAGVTFFLAMAFMAKCLHMALGVLILLAYLPRIYKKLKFRHYLTAAITGILPVTIWGVIRYLFDGWVFIRGMLGMEVVDRIESSKDYLGYVTYILSKPWIDLALLAVIIALVMKKREPNNQGNRKSFRMKLQGIVNHPLYLFGLWMIVPLVIYSASGAFMEWYSYISFVPFCILVGAIVGKASFGGLKKWGNILALLLIGVSVGTAVYMEVNKLNTLSYVNNVDLRQDLKDLVDRNPELTGRKMYIENSRNEYKEQGVWEQNNIVDAYLAGNFIPVDGGVSLFLEDEDDTVLLVLSKNLMEPYYDSIAGHVILVDGNDYLIFCKQTYS